MGYTYDNDVDYLDQDTIAKLVSQEQHHSSKYLQIVDLDRSAFRGPFLIHVYFKRTADAKEELIGMEPVLKRWDMSNCRNCQNRYKTDFKIDLTKLAEDVSNIDEQIVVKFREKVETEDKHLTKVGRFIRFLTHKDIDLKEKFDVAPKVALLDMA